MKKYCDWCKTRIGVIRDGDLMFCSITDQRSWHLDQRLRAKKRKRDLEALVSATE